MHFPLHYETESCAAHYWVTRTGRGPSVTSPILLPSSLGYLDYSRVAERGPPVFATAGFVQKLSLHTSGSRRAFSTARTSKDPMTRMHDGSGGHHPGTARASHEPRQIASHSGLERNLPRRLPLAFVSLTVGEWVIPALQVSQKRKRSPTVGSMVLRLMKPFARPPLTCENMIPAYASNFFANCQSATKETASNVPWQFANAEGLLQLTNAPQVGCV